MKKVLLIGAQGMDNLGDDYMYSKIVAYLKENNCTAYASNTKTDFYFEDLCKKNDVIQIPILQYKNKVDLIRRIVKEYMGNIFDAVIFIGGVHKRLFRISLANAVVAYNVGV